MGQHAFSQSFGMSVLAAYQSLMGGIHAAIIADGWVQTADAGQTDPSGVVGLPVANTDTNFDLYKSPGTLTPVYIRISYQRSAGNSPQLVVQCGTGTDGAGALTGVTSTSRTISPGTTTDPTHAYVSGGLGWLTICLDAVQTNGNGCYFLLDRSVDGTETYTNTFYTQLTYSNGIGCFQETKMLDGSTQPPIQSGIRSPFPSPTTGGGTWIIGPNLTVPLMLPIIAAGNVQHSPNVGVHTTAASDFSVDTVTIINVYGTDHNYLVSGQPMNSNQRPLLRYE